MIQPGTVVLLGIIDLLINTITQSWYLSAIAVAVMLSVGLSLLSGLIDIAVYLATLAGVVLAILAIVNQFAPGLIPIISGPQFALGVNGVDPFFIQSVEESIISHSESVLDFSGLPQ